MCSVTRYVKVGTNIEAWYVDIEQSSKKGLWSDTSDDGRGSDTHRWFQGIVKKVHRYGEDRFGRYVECDVLYDDGEMVKEQVFYDGDYGNDVWRFAGDLGGLVSNLVSYVEELEEEGDDDYEECSDEDEESDEESDEDDDSAYEYDSDSDSESESSSDEHLATIGAALMRLEDEKDRAQRWTSVLSVAVAVVSTAMGMMLANDYCSRHPGGAFFC